MANSTTIPNTDPASEIDKANNTGTGTTKTSGGIIANVQSATPTDYTSQLTDLYKKNFNRAPDQAGLDFYNQKAQGGVSLDDINSAMLGSAEYKALHPQGGAPSGNAGSTDQGAGQLTASTYTPTQLGEPTKLNVTKDQTVAGQMQSLIDPNNPYYQQWQTAGMEAANSRGLLNSSMAQTGILNSVMAGATPIAAADAATYAKAAGYNADMSNQFSQFNANALNTAGAFNAGQANSLASTKYTADKSAATQLGVTDKNNATALAQSQLSADTQKYVADQSAATQLAVTKLNTQSQAAISAAHDANANLIQSNQQAQAAYNSYVAAVAQIDQNGNMDAAAKATAIATQTAIFNNAITSLRNATPGTADMTVTPDVSTAINQVNGVDVSQMLNFNG